MKEFHSEFVSVGVGANLDMSRESMLGKSERGCIFGTAVNFSFTSRVSRLPLPRMAMIFLVTRPVTNCSCCCWLPFWSNPHDSMPCPTRGQFISE